MKCTPILVQKNDCWIWIAVDRNGKRFIHCVLGSRDAETGKGLWSAIEENPVESVKSNHWKARKCFLPKGMQTQSKADIDTVEGYKSLFCHFLARLRRKSKCYTKGMQMLQYPGYPFDAKVERNPESYIRLTMSDGVYRSALGKAKLKKNYPQDRKNVSGKHASIRAEVEHPFCVINRKFIYTKTGYRELAKNTSQLYGLFGLADVHSKAHQCHGRINVSECGKRLEKDAEGPLSRG